MTISTYGSSNLSGWVGGKAAPEEIERICACSLSIWHLEILWGAWKYNANMHMFHLAHHTVDTENFKNVMNKWIKIQVSSIHFRISFIIIFFLA